MKVKGLLTLKSLSNEQIHDIISFSILLKQGLDVSYSGKKFSTLFFENSTRTHYSFIAALTNLDINDVDLNENCIRVFGKGKKERMVFFLPSVNKHLNEYINEYRNKFFPVADSKALFLSSKGCRITARAIENILNNGNVNKKKVLISKLAQIKSNKKEKLIASNLEEATVVASSENECIITLNQIYLCDFMMQPTNKKKVLSLINSEENLVKDYYAIPSSVWEIILSDYTTQFKSGIKKPQLNHINIDVRLYNEENNQESEMQKIAFDFFGENVSFE